MKIAILYKFRGNLSLHKKYLKCRYSSNLKSLDLNEARENVDSEEELMEKHKLSEVQELKERLVALNHNVKVLNSGKESELYNGIKEFQPLLVINVSEEREVLFLEKNSVPYVGSNLETMVLSSDKYKTKRSVRNIDSLKTAEDYLIMSIEEACNILKIIDKKKNYIAKPNLGRGSAGISDKAVIRQELLYSCNEKEKIELIKDHFKRILFGLKQPVLVEELINSGFLNDYKKENFKELTVGVLGYENPKVLLPLEIRKEENSVLTFEAKMNDQAKFIVPADIGSKLNRKLEDTALKIYRQIGARDYLRIDFIVYDEDLYFLETNTAPGLMMNHLNNGIANSYLGIMAEKEGINLIEEIIKIAKKRYNF